jgi:hypothetical protein
MQITLNKSIKDGLERIACYQTGTICVLDENAKLHSTNDEPALITPTGEKSWYKHGELHRIGKPAIIFPDGEEWYFNGKLHKLNGPAKVRQDREEWWINGKLHRLDGPAVQIIDDYEAWYKDGKKHREGGPAVTYLNIHDSYCGQQEWWLNGQRHRADGPAITNLVGDENYCYEGYELFSVNGKTGKVHFSSILKIHQEFIIKMRPDLIRQIPKLDPVLKKKYLNELNLSGIEI